MLNLIFSMAVVLFKNLYYTYNVKVFSEVTLPENDYLFYKLIQK